MVFEEGFFFFLSYAKDVVFKRGNYDTVCVCVSRLWRGRRVDVNYCSGIYIESE